MTHGWITPDDDTFDSMRANQIARWLYRLSEEDRQSMLKLNPRLLDQLGPNLQPPPPRRPWCGNPWPHPDHLVTLRSGEAEPCAGIEAAPKDPVSDTREAELIALVLRHIAEHLTMTHEMIDGDWKLGDLADVAKMFARHPRRRQAWIDGYLRATSAAVSALTQVADLNDPSGATASVPLTWPLS